MGVVKARLNFGESCRKLEGQMRTTALALATGLAMAAGIANSAVTTNTRTDFSATVWVPCAADGAGESVDLAGSFHTLVTSTINGNNVSGKIHDQPMGVNGNGQITGMSYRGTGVTQTTFKNSLQNGQSTQTFVNNFRLIGQGPGNNYLVHQNTNVTINANGDTTVTHDNFSVECK